MNRLQERYFDGLKADLQLGSGLFVGRGFSPYMDSSGDATIASLFLIKNHAYSTWLLTILINGHNKPALAFVYSALLWRATPDFNG
tara:strand:- start:1105 stop:1362 length:258 start_codon:yes stop_codon:yes gene_type:complete